MRLNLYGTPTKKNSQNTCNTLFCKCSLPFFPSQPSFWSTALTLPRSLTSHSLFAQENFTPTSTLTSPNTGTGLQRDLQMTRLSLPSGLLCYTSYYWPSIPGFSLSFSLLFAVSEYFLSCLSRLLSACLLAHCFPTIASYPQQSRGPYCFNPACILPPANLLVSPWPLPQVADLNT